MSNKLDGKAAGMTELWLLEEERQGGLERWLAARPKCSDCGEPIREERALQLETGLICGECRCRRMVEVETE